MAFADHGGGDGFCGFSAEALDLLRDLRANNNRSWFEAHKPVYHEFLVEPFRRLVADLSAFMLAIDPRLDVTPATGRTLSRIHRDTTSPGTPRPGSGAPPTRFYRHPKMGLVTLDNALPSAPSTAGTTWHTSLHCASAGAGNPPRNTRRGQSVDHVIR